MFVAFKWRERKGENGKEPWRAKRQTSSQREKAGEIRQDGRAVIQAGPWQARKKIPVDGKSQASCQPERHILPGKFEDCGILYRSVQKRGLFGCDKYAIEIKSSLN